MRYIVVGDCGVDYGWVVDTTLTGWARFFRNNTVFAGTRAACRERAVQLNAKECETVMSIYNLLLRLNSGKLIFRQVKASNFAGAAAMAAALALEESAEPISLSLSPIQ
jgi:hypothetical protein